MTAFAPLLDLLADVPDPRRAQGKLYQFPHVLLFTILAIDGKTLRGSFDNFKDRLAAQILSVFATQTALVLAHRDIEEKSNEIPAAQAMTAANATLIVQVKDNQPSPHQQARDITTTATPLSQVSSHDKGRGRDEKRIVTVFDSAKALDSSEWQPHVAAIIRVERSVYTRLTHTTATAFYVANAVLPANKAAEATRGHWGIENTSHDSRDVTMREDASRIRCNPSIFARPRSFAYNILKANRVDTLNQDRYRAALGGLQRLLEMLAIRKR